MKAVAKSKSGLEVQQIEKPVPDDNEILVKVYAATVTAGDVVLHNLPGFLYWSPIRKILGVPPKKTTPGHEFAGVVEAVGKNVTRFEVGDQVFGTTTGLTVGANAEYICLPELWETGVITIKPTHVPYEQAAAVPVGGMTALYLLRQADIQPGQKVLVYGASGSVGTYAVQLARYFDAAVTAVCSSRNTELVKSLGADRVIDYTVEDFTEGGETYDVILDAVGKISAAKSKRVLKTDGRFVSIRSSTSEATEALIFLRERIEAGELRPVIDRRYSLEQINDAYQYVQTGRKTGNVIITIADDDTDQQPRAAVSVL